MTRDIIVVTDTDKDRFAREVFNQMTSVENRGYSCEVKFATVEDDHAWSKIKFSALIHVYDAE